MKKNFYISLLVFLSLNYSFASEKIYSWIDDEGIKHFSDSPTYDDDKKTKGTEQYLIDHHGNKQPIKYEKLSNSAVRKTPVINDRKVLRKKPIIKTLNPKSGPTPRNLNYIDLIKGFISLLYPIFIILSLLALLKLVIASLMKDVKFNILKTIFRKNEPPYRNSNDSQSQQSKRNSSEFKGFEGEQIVIDLLYHYLDRKKYYFFNDVTLPDNESTTQIDHLIISQFGIFIIETKNMNGSIYGNPYQKNWIQWLADGKHTFQNPFRQNYKHKKCVERLLECHSTIFFDVIVFIDSAKFPKGMPEKVFYPKQLIDFIESKRKVLLTTNEIEGIISKLISYRIDPSFETDKRHKENIRNKRRKV